MKCTNKSKAIVANTILYYIENGVEVSRGRRGEVFRGYIILGMQRLAAETFRFKVAVRKKKKARLLCTSISTVNCKTISTL